MCNRGCVTPTIIHNWQESCEGDMELIDGYDVLPEDVQEMVKRALEQGHVDDDVWKGVSVVDCLAGVTVLILPAGSGAEPIHRREESGDVREDPEEEGWGMLLSFEYCFTSSNDS